ncbi:MAG: hypothetical protein ABI591_09835 [Kofleriaceae bacterium]
MRILGLIVLAAGCAEPPTPAAPTPSSTPSLAAPARYQVRWGGLSVRDGDRLVDAPAADVAVAKGYPTWPFKGTAVDATVLTLMTAKTDYAVGEAIRVLHVLDVSVPGRGVYIMGPKRPAGEYLDGVLVTGLPEIPEYPWVATYDGAVLPSPAIDYNYEITSYRFATPGTHELQWKLGAIASNVITVQVR